MYSKANHFEHRGGTPNKQKALHFFKNTTNLDAHLNYWRTLVKDNITLGLIVSNKVIKSKLLRNQIVKQLTTYINEHSLVTENSTIKFICLNRCFQFMTSFYLISRQVAQKILRTLPKDIKTRGDILPDDIYRLYGNLTSVYWEDKSGRHSFTKNDSVSTEINIPINKTNTINLDIIPIDIIYTWVDHKCPKWNQKFSEYLSSDHFRLHQNIYNSEFMDLSRYRNRDELRYSLRSVDKYMPWVRTIFIVTDGQKPDWLVDGHPKIKLINHSELLEEQFLPTFNSLSLESYLHRIPDLSDYFIYFNDDFFVNQSIDKSTFINQEGQILLYSQENPNIDRCDYFRDVVRDMQDDDSWNSSENEKQNTLDEQKKELDIFIESCYKLFKITPKGKASCHESGHYSQWKNVNKLLDRLFSLEDRRFISHAPYPQLKKTSYKLEKMFDVHYKNTRNSRFRSTKCIGTTNSLYPYYNYYIDSAKIIDNHQVTQTLYFQNNPLINDLQFRTIKNNKFKPVFFVIQDSTTYTQNQLLDDQMDKILKTLYPEKSQFER
jgi:RNase P protein component